MKDHPYNGYQALCTDCGGAPDDHPQEPRFLELRKVLALETIAAHFKLEDELAKQRAEESWNSQQYAKLIVQPEPSECIYCHRNARCVLRGNRYIGCVLCITGIMKAAEALPHYPGSEKVT